MLTPCMRFCSFSLFFSSPIPQRRANAHGTHAIGRRQSSSWGEGLRSKNPIYHPSSQYSLQITLVRQDPLTQPRPAAGCRTVRIASSRDSGSLGWCVHSRRTASSAASVADRNATRPDCHSLLRRAGRCQRGGPSFHSARPFACADPCRCAWRRGSATSSRCSRMVCRGAES